MPKIIFHVAFQMDCEATQHAIRNKEMGEHAITGFAEILENKHLLATYYVIPTDIEASSQIYRDLANRGHEVGLHVHPADMGYEEFLGVYGPDEQRKILSEASDRFSQVMGFRPRGICIGYVSSNDYTYPVMNELGFSHGTLSLPSRILTECASVWAGSRQDIHYVHPYNRLLSGGLDLVDIPLTVDTESRMWGGKHPQDLRVELVDAKNHWYTVAKNVDRQIKQDLPVRHITVLTHNTFEYSDHRDFRRETLLKLIDHIYNIIPAKGGQVIGSTMEQIAGEYRRKCPIQDANIDKLTLDTRCRR